MPPVTLEYLGRVWWRVWWRVCWRSGQALDRVRHHYESPPDPLAHALVMQKYVSGGFRFCLNIFN